MSVKIMGQVWELDLPHAEKFVLLAMADHADHDGGNVYPSLTTVAKKTGYSDRQVQRVVASLEALGLLVPIHESAGSATVYRIDASAAPRLDMAAKPPTKCHPRQNVTPDMAAKPPTKCHPRQNVTPDIYDTDSRQNVTTTPDIYDSPLSYKEPSFEPSFEPEEGQAPAPESKEAPRQEAPEAAVDRQPGRRPCKAAVHVAYDPPSCEAVEAWLRKNGHDTRHANGFLAHYGANNWMQNSGKPVTSWPHSLAGWVERESRFGPPRASPPGPRPQAITGTAAVVNSLTSRLDRLTGGK